MSPWEDIKVAVAGFGAIGQKVAERLDQGIPGLSLAAISARDLARVEKAIAGYRHPVPAVPAERLPALADVIVECAPAAAFRSIAEAVVDAGRTLVVISVGALIANPDIEDRAKKTGARIIVPTGALIGFDAVRAAAEGSIESVRMVSRKPPRGLAGAPHLVANAINIDNLTAPLKVFEGSAREAVAGFPANVNVAAALSLAGIGPERTVIEVWADPSIDRNTHTVSVVSDSANFSMSIANIPSENPKTGKITALSIIAALRKLTATVCVGT